MPSSQYASPGLKLNGLFKQVPALKLHGQLWDKFAQAWQDNSSQLQSEASAYGVEDYSQLSNLNSLFPQLDPVKLVTKFSQVNPEVNLRKLEQYKALDIATRLLPVLLTKNP